jgi:hypothetical protein
MGNRSTPLVEHWDGSNWSVVDGTGFPSRSELSGVDARSSSDVWVVGDTPSRRACTNVTLVEHWDGQTWSRVASPHPGGPGGSSLGGVSAISANDAWAVGADDLPVQITTHTLAMRWDGARWTTVPTPKAPKSDRGLDAVSARSADNVWAVGGTGVNQRNVGRTLAERWDGNRWTQTPTINPGRQLSGLSGVATVNSDDAWAVGLYANDDSRIFALIEHYSGGRWVRFHRPNLHASTSGLGAVSASSPSDVWAVGQEEIGGVYQTLIMHYDGQHWALVPSPSPEGIAGLSGVTSGSAKSTWSVGSFTSGEQESGLIERWTGRRWRVTRS